MKIEVVSVPWLSVFKHSGLKVTFPTGQQVIYANSPGRGVARQTLLEFADGREITVAPFRCVTPPSIVVARAEQMMGLQYDLFRWNCDHFVSAALGLAPESKQLQFVVGTLASVLLLFRLAA